MMTKIPQEGADRPWASGLDGRLGVELAAAELELGVADRERLLPVWAENLDRREALRNMRFGSHEEPFAGLAARPPGAAARLDPTGLPQGDEADADPCSMSLAGQVRLLRSGVLSAEALLELYLNRIERYDPVLRAYITVRTEEARAEARASDEARPSNAPRSPIEGTVIALKDCLPIAGTRMTAGSRLLSDYRATADASLVSRLKAAGAVLIGTTSLHEFGAGPALLDGPLATGRNPWDLGRIPGGSSSGSAVAVSASLASAAFGTDAAGSVRIPAAYSGIVGFKPTRGAIDRAGSPVLTWSLDTIGPMARSVDDAALLLEAASDIRVGAETLTAGVAGLRLGVLRRYCLDAPDVSDDVRQATEEALGVLADLGAEIVTVDIPSIDHNDVAYTTLLAESFATHRTNLLDRPEAYSDWFRVQLHAAALVPASDYLAARRLQGRLVADCLEALRDVDALVCPAQPTAATPFGASFIPALTQPRSRFTRLWNITGFPALVLPHGQSADGLPLSLQVIARPHDEATALRVGRAFEINTRWHKLRPDPARWTT